MRRSEGRKLACCVCIQLATPQFRCAKIQSDPLTQKDVGQRARDYWVRKHLLVWRDREARRRVPVGISGKVNQSGATLRILWHRNGDVAVRSRLKRISKR